MSNRVCTKCFDPLVENSTICANCGHQSNDQVVAKIDTKFDGFYKNNPFTFEHINKEKEVYQQFQDPKTYVRPLDYKNTTTSLQRIIGTIKMDAHVVEEITSRKDLQKEGWILLLINLTIFVIIQQITIVLMPEHLEVISTPGLILDIVFRTYLAGILFIYSIPIIGRFIGYTKSDLDNSSVRRILSFAYFAAIVPKIVAFFTGVLQSDILAFSWITFSLYYLIIFSFAIRRAMHKGYLTSFTTLIIAIIVLNLYNIAVSEIIEMLFDGSYVFLKV